MLRIISYNIRYNNPNDGDNAWPYRQERVAALLQRHQPDLLGLQEVLHEQLTDLAAALPEFAWIGVGRDDGAEAGEYAPIFYRRDRFSVQAQGNFWLSETPDVVCSIGWDAACVRVATWAQLRDKETKSQFLFLNTHLDHRGMTAQVEGVKLLHHFLYENFSNMIALVTGDFNCTADSATYRALTHSPIRGFPFIDLMEHSQSAHEGPTSTFTTDFADPLQAKIDYIFLRPTTPLVTNVAVFRHAILADKKNGRYPSDHLPVLAEVVL